MRRQFLFLIFSGICLTSAAQHSAHDGHNHGTEPTATLSNEKKADPQHTIAFSEEVYDFGKIPQGKPVHHSFDFQNTGKTGLKLTNVQASCGCTTPEWEKDKEIGAGGKSAIKVGYNAAAEGPFSKVITVTYNEGLVKILTIKGEVWKTPATSAPANNATGDLQ
jgi:hypothetical protein